MSTQAKSKGPGMSFSGKQAIVVGGSSGIGLETARLLHDDGASVTLVGRRQEKLD